MAIGDLYNASNVKVGQAAVLVAPAFTALPAITATVPNMNDPFSIVPFTDIQITIATGTSGTFTISVTYGGATASSASIIIGTTTPAAIQAGLLSGLQTAFPSLALTTGDVAVTGTSPTTTAPCTINISVPETLALDGVWSTTGATGGPPVITQSSWQPVGATDQGWTWASSKTIQDITIEEQSTLVNRLLSSQQFTVTAALSEDIASTLALVHNMTPAAVARVASTSPGYTTLTLTDTPIQYAIAVLMGNALGPGGGGGGSGTGYPRWLYIPATTCLDNVSTPLRRAAAKRIYSAQFTSVCQTSLIKVYEFTTPA